jgi:AraC-like DNA-binding protein
MASRPILLVDLRHFAFDLGTASILERQWAVHGLSASNRPWQTINQGIKTVQPGILCFEFDYPDSAGLRILRETKNRFSSIPIIMVTEQNSDALTLWALRSRVWDYFSRPFSATELLDSIGKLYSILDQPMRSAARRLLMPPSCNIPDEAGMRKVFVPRAFRGALLHVERHLQGTIRQRDLAHAFDMTPSRFSRLFKQMSGMTFRSYLSWRRTREAEKLLRNPSATVSDVCYAVGFNDVSHFIRSFRRHMGVTPSRYQQAWRGNAI